MRYLGFKSIIFTPEESLKWLEKNNAKGIIFSGGSASVYDIDAPKIPKEILNLNIPILGICLGHQAIGQAFGGKVVRAKRMMHGKTSTTKQLHNSCLFEGLPETFTTTRYHSLTVEQESLPDVVIPTAYSTDDHEIMALQIKDKQIYGVQFHPESILSEHGHAILNNFLKLYL